MIEGRESSLTAQFGDIRVDREKVPVYPSSISPGMLIRIECYEVCLFPIRDVEIELQGLEYALGQPVPADQGPWGLLKGPGEALIGMVVRVTPRRHEGAEKPILEVLLGEDIVVIDEIRMGIFPFSSPAGTWRVFELRREEEEEEEET